MKQGMYTVSELNRYIKALIQTSSPLRNLWVEGEISNFKLHRSGHMYLTLKDAASAIRCVFFRGQNQNCPFLPSDGMHVLVRGNVSVYEKEGIYQFYVEEMEPAGIGSLYIAFEQLKKRLEEEGLFDPRFKKRLPGFPRLIAVVTSPTGAALQDILAMSRRRFPHTAFLVVESLMQGSRAPEDITQALRYLNSREDIEVIVLARGGGALEELWAFNTEEVARAVFASRIPVVSAIGHQTDYTICDFVADQRAPTPTAAAELILPHIEEIERVLQESLERTRKALRGKLMQEQQRLSYIIKLQLMQAPFKHLREREMKVKELGSRLSESAIRALETKARKLESAAVNLEGLSPLKIMQLGYSYCEDESGQVIRSVKSVAPHQKVKLHFWDGQIMCRVEDVDTGQS